MRKIIGIIAMCVFCLNNIHAQTPQQNLEKYWLYRDRLDKYFVLIDANTNKIGTNTPFYYNYKQWSSEEQNYYHVLSTGDGNHQMQFYIGMLATEYALLKRYGQDYTKTRNQLLYALKTIQRYDRYAESYFREVEEKGGDIVPINTFEDYTFPWANNMKAGANTGTRYIVPTIDYANAPLTDINGFMVRNDIASDFIEKNKATYPFLNNYCREKAAMDGRWKGMPHEMSQDNIWNYLLNFSLVKILVDDAEIQALLKEITKKMITAMQGTLPEAENWILPDKKAWVIRNPVTGLIVTQGGMVEEIGLGLYNFGGTKYAFAESGNFITGASSNIIGSDNLHYAMSQYKRNMFYTGLKYFNTSNREQLYTYLIFSSIMGNDKDFNFWYNNAIDFLENFRYIVVTNTIETIGNNQIVLTTLPDDSFNNNSFIRLNNVSASSSVVTLYDKETEIRKSIMDLLIENTLKPSLDNPQAEHLILIKKLIVDYQLKKGIKDNEASNLCFAVNSNDLYQNIYKPLLNKAPICGPMNFDTPQRVTEWSVENRLTHSDKIEVNYDVNKLLDAQTIGVYNGIDYMLLHNLVWLVYMPSNVLFLKDTDARKTYSANAIVSDQDILINETAAYSAGEIRLKPGFTASKGCNFTAKISSDVAYSYRNTKSIATTNNCFACRPFTSVNNPINHQIKEYICGDIPIGNYVLTDKDTIDKKIPLHSLLKSYTIQNAEQQSDSFEYISIEPQQQLPQSSMEFSIYPNPISTTVTITHSIETKKISIFSNSGVLVHEIVVNSSNNTTIDMADYNPGIYFIQLDNGILHKIIKQ